MKLADYIKDRYEGLSRRLIKRALERGACVVNGKIERFASREIDPKKDKVVYKDIRPKALDKLIIAPENIIFEDEHLLIYNKEAGYPSLATKDKARVNTHGELKKFLEKREGRKVFLSPAHRLDKDTSGLLLFAKSDRVLNKLFEAFREKTIKKNYEAIVDGLPKKQEGIIDIAMQLERKGAGWQRWAVVSDKKSSASAKNKEIKPAVTAYRVVKNYPKKKYSHLKLTPRTGRMHQLRVHLKFLGHPILGDSFYGQNFNCKELPLRHLLHASSLELRHPMTGQNIKVFASLPQDFMELLE